MVMELVRFSTSCLSVTEVESIRNLFYQVSNLSAKSIFLMSVVSRCYCFFISDIVGCVVSFFISLIRGDQFY